MKTNVEQLQEYFDNEQKNGLVEMSFTPGSDETVNPEDAAAVALAMLRYKGQEDTLAVVMDIVKPMITEYEMQIAFLKGILGLAESKFLFYEESHRAKNTEDADQKADVNRTMAMFCRAGINYGQEKPV